MIVKGSVSQHPSLAAADTGGPALTIDCGELGPATTMVSTMVSTGFTVLSAFESNDPNMVTTINH